MTARGLSRDGWLSRLRSTVGGIEWPAVLSGRAASLAAVMNQLDRTQWLAGEELEALQLAQLRELAAHAIEHIPFYRERLAAAGIGAAADITPDSWQRIPVLERAEVQERGAELRSATVPESHGRIAESGTSGSTGRKLLVAKTELDDFYFQAFVLRAGDWGRWDTMGTLAAIRSYPIGAGDYPDGLRWPDWCAPYGFVCDSGPSFGLSVSASITQQAQWLERIQPDYLTTYPSILPDLIDECRRRGVRLSRLKQVRTFTECLDPAVRKLCMEHWGATVQDTYSAQETGYLALQCPEHEHYHVQSEGALVEVLDEQGKSCKPGTSGRVVVTPLHNFAMPLVRYAIGDYAEVGPPCPCGRGLPALNLILGRVRNMLVLPDGNRIWPRASHFHRELPVKQFQMIQTGVTTIELRLVSAHRGTGEDEAKITAMIAKWLGYPFEVTYTYVDEIPRGANGKFEDFRCEIGAG